MELKEYSEKLRERGKDSKAYRKFQLIGLEVAELLGDTKHKALYIKLAKDHGAQNILSLAKDIAQRSEVKNKGAYFTRIIHEKNPPVKKKK